MLTQFLSLVVAGSLVGSTLASARSEEDAAKLKTLFAAGQTSYDLISNNADLAVTSVILASQFSGGRRLVKTGTLTQTGPDMQSFRYSANPRDKLVVKFLDNETFTFVVQDFRGDANTDSVTFLAGNHKLKFKVQKVNSLQLTVLSELANGAKQAKVFGTATFEDVAHELNVTLNGSYSSTGDENNSESHGQYSVEGSVESADSTVQVNEEFKEDFVSSSQGPDSFNTTSKLERTLSSSLTAGNEQWSLSDAKVQKAFNNGSPSEPEYWAGTSGNVLKNGEAAGTLQAVYQLPTVKIVGSLGDQQVDLEDWSAQENPGL